MFLRLADYKYSRPLLNIRHILLTPLRDPCGANILGWGGYITSHTQACVGLKGLEELLKQSDIVSIHAPLNERTKNLIGRNQLALMKPTAYLINMGRGAIVVEEDLAAAVDAGVIAGAGMDVFVVEPIPEDHPYLKMQHPERMRLAPHVAWASMEARQRLVGIMADNIRKGW